MKYRRRGSRSCQLTKEKASVPARRVDWLSTSHAPRSATVRGASPAAAIIITASPCPLLPTIPSLPPPSAGRSACGLAVLRARAAASQPRPPPPRAGLVRPDQILVKYAATPDMRACAPPRAHASRATQADRARRAPPLLRLARGRRHRRARSPAPPPRRAVGGARLPCPHRRHVHPQRPRPQQRAHRLGAAAVELRRAVRRERPRSLGERRRRRRPRRARRDRRGARHRRRLRQPRALSPLARLLALRVRPRL